MNNTLIHYGVLGMKWGVRRTPEQLGHVSKKEPRQVERLRKERDPNLPHYNQKAGDIYRNMDQMDDKELQQALNRLRNQMEVERLSSMDSFALREGKNYVSSAASIVNSVAEVDGKARIVKALMFPKKK